MNIKSLVKISLASIIVGTSFLGCTAKGPQFSTFKNAEKNSGMLYAYRPSKFTGMVVPYDIVNVATGKPIGELRNNSYFSKNLPVGKYVLRAVTNVVKVEIKNNELVCIRSFIDGEMDVGHFQSTSEIHQVPNDICLQEIRETNENI